MTESEIFQAILVPATLFLTTDHLISMDIHCDILIVGGGAGGTAAALAAAAFGAEVCLIEETYWLGGQLTTQGVCTPDEQSYIETFGATRRYAAFRQAARDHYRSTYRLSPQAQADPAFNPGACWVSRLAYEPKVGMEILRAMTRPFEESGLLRLYFGTRVLGCELDADTGDMIVAVTTEAENGERNRFLPHYVLDATDLGELLPLCGREVADWVLGAESRAQTAEPDAPSTARPDWVQPFTFPFALEWSPETVATNVILPPPGYEALKAQQNFTIMHGAITGVFNGRAPWWRYRRILAAENFDDPRISHDVAMINTAGNDYYGGNVIGARAGGPDEIAATLARARRTSLAYLYWLQTECPREADAALPPGRYPDGYEPPAQGYPELLLRTDLFDTPDGCSLQPYIRESRRIRALRPILEQEIVVRDFQGGVCRGELARANFMPDSVGIGHYALDIHPNGHGEPNAYVATRPFQIPLGALVPVRLRNLLPACKNLGVTHLTNGAYRLHPIEWNIGESAGLLACFCMRSAVTPQQLVDVDKMVRDFQDLLLNEGIALHWYVDVPLDHPAFKAVQTLATAGLPLGNPTDLLFRPDELLADSDWQFWCAHLGLQPPAFEGARADAAQQLLDLWRLERWDTHE